MLVSLNCIREEKPGDKWKTVFNSTWPYYKNWFLIEGYLARPGYLTCAEELKKFMPELVPVYNQLTELAGGGDLAARYLSMYCPPPYMSGCTQLVWQKETISLIRNYDYNPKMFEGVMLYTNWLQPVIGISDCNWGLLDGINAGSLAASLTFGGRKVTGTGFGIPIIMRYILETCDSVKSAVEKLKSIPVHMAYNVTLADKNFDYATVYLSPDREIIITKDRVASNHQQNIEWHDYAVMTDSKERMEYLYKCIAVPGQTDKKILKAFFQEPLYHGNFAKAFLTLYTAEYKPADLNVTVHWPGKSVLQSFADFREQKTVINTSGIKSGKQII